MDETAGRYPVGATGRMTVDLFGEGGARVVAANITAAAATVTNAATGVEVNGQTDKDVYKAGAWDENFDILDQTIDSEDLTTLGWDVQLADIALLDATQPREEHLLKLVATYTLSGAAKVLRVDHRLRCIDTPSICTIDDVVRLSNGFEPGGPEAFLVEDMIDAVAALVEGATRRKLRKTTTNETITLSVPPRSRVIQLPRFPISSITSIMESSSGVFTDSVALDPDTYYIDADIGTVEKRFVDWVSGPGVIRVAYKGGLFSDPAGAPADLRHFSARQAKFWWETKDKIGVSGEAVEGTNTTLFQQQGLLPEFKQALRKYRTPVLLA